MCESGVDMDSYCQWVVIVDLFFFPAPRVCAPFSFLLTSNGKAMHHQSKQTTNKQKMDKVNRTKGWFIFASQFKIKIIMQGWIEKG